jgi:hypothetical protein
MGGAGIRVEDDGGWIAEGNFVHEVGTNDLTVWKMANVQSDSWSYSFDAVSVTTGGKLRTHTFQRNEEKPGGWRLANEMEILGLCAMTPEEYRAWLKAWYQGKGAWHHRDEPKK